MGATSDDIANDLSDGLIVSGSNMLNMQLWAVECRFASDEDEPISFKHPNPKKTNSKSWQRYELYQNAITIREAKKAGIWPGDLRNDLARGFLQFGHLNLRTAANGQTRPAKITDGRKS